MTLKYKDKTIKINECVSFIDRLRGFMFYKRPITYGLLFKKCNSIHTFFMKQNIQVIMTDKDNKILYYYNNLERNKIVLPKKNVYHVYELPAFYFKIKEKDCLFLLPE